DDSRQVLNLLKDFKLFSIGHSKKIKNLLWTIDTEEDLKSYIFDYQYTVSAGNSHHIHRRTVFFFYSKQLGLPDFRMQPEKFMHRLAGWLGWEDIDFVDHEVFSKQYHLKGGDEELIRDTFTDDVLHYFKFQKNWCVEGLNYFLIVYRNEKRLPPGQIKEYYEVAREIYGILKDKGFRV
ncbi:MAG: hypothetical protein KDC80_13405, partial [Saprospiraceae bacterium]|nr:hypothetical protein [Saprospiraceae bacterium]